MYTDEEYDIAQREYWRQVSESEGFDIEDVSIPSSMAGMISGLIPYDCQRERGGCPYRVLVNLYAQLGLRQYSLLKKNTLEFVSMVKVNMSQNLVSSFYITLLVRDSITLEEKEFQVRTDERSCVSLYLACSVARFKDEVTIRRPFVPHFHYGAEVPEPPDWPSHTLAAQLPPGSFETSAMCVWSADTPGPSDTYARPSCLSDSLLEQFLYLLPAMGIEPSEFERMCVLEDSRCRSSDFDWTYLYLKLVVCAQDRWISEEALSKLEIIYAVVIPTGVPFYRPGVQNLNLFIVYKGLDTAEIGKDVERRAIVSQVVNDSGCFSLRGKLL